MRRNPYLVIALFAALGTPLTHCATTSDPGSSESHFLHECGEPCGTGLDCVCGVCSLACTTNATCAGHAGATCLAGPASCSTALLCDVSCKSDADCASTSLHCVARRCRDRSPIDASVPETQPEASLPNEPRFDAGRPVTQPDSGASTTGADCQLAPGTPWACSGLPGAAGAEVCPRSVGAGTPCCAFGNCGFDVGQGCAEANYTPPGIVEPTVSACKAARGSPGVLYGNDVADFAIGDGGVFVLTRDQNGNSASIVSVRNSDCSTQSLYTTNATQVGSLAPGSTLDSIQVVGQTVYLAGGDAQNNGTLLALPTTGGPPSVVPLNALLQGNSFNPELIVKSGTSLYVLTSPNRDSDASLNEPAMIEVPCCGAPPRLLAATAKPFAPFSATLLDAGTFLFAAGQAELLSSGVTSGVGAFDLSSHRMSTLISSDQSITPCDGHDGLLYAVVSNSIVTIDPLTCTRRELVSRPGSEIIDLHVDADGTVFWAESYISVTTARIFMMRPGSTSFSQIWEVPAADVYGLRSDDAYLYWTGHSASSVYRMPKPK